MALPRRPSALIAGAAAIGMLALVTLWRPDPFLLNTTPSMPVGLYQRASAPLALGAVVTVRARDVAPAYAALRGFSDPDDRFLKRVAAAPGDRVCAAGSTITRNGAPVAERARRDARGRALPTWEGCVDLRSGEVLLLGDAPDSFDGRYWGVTPLAQIEGVWRPVATRAGAAGLR